MDTVPIVPYPFLSVPSEFSEDVCFILQELERGETLCGLCTGLPHGMQGLWAK